MALLLSMFVLFSLRGAACEFADAPNLEGATYPLTREYISSSFGARLNPVTHRVQNHAGIDLVAEGDLEVHSIDDGVVVFAALLGGYGNLVSIRHGRDLSSHYAHLGTILVNVGEPVSRGAVIGIVGSTGKATGAHLHFEIRRHGCALDPRDSLPELGARGFG